jgi:sulfatase maturation enzyme AslB (radical SAM superfamily)
MKDTLRVLISWTCNLACPYCCNEIPAVRQGIRAASFRDLDFAPYSVVCVSGGEPLLFPTLLRDVCRRAKGKFVVLYTNGTRLTPELARDLQDWGVQAVNVGLHYPAMFDMLIQRVEKSVKGTQLRVRYHVEDIYRSFPGRHPGLSFKFWHRGDCDRDNEDRVVLEARNV